MLRKNVLRNFKKKPIRLISTIFMIMLASILYVTLSYMIRGMELNVDQYVRDYNQEHFSFRINRYYLLSEDDLNMIDTTPYPHPPI